MNLEKVFNQVSIKMLADFNEARSALSHRGQKGDSNEATVKDFLKRYLPRSLDIATGVLVDSTGAESKQLDVILCDSAKTPIFFQSGDIRVIPVECAYAIIEVKAELNGLPPKKWTWS